MYRLRVEDEFDSAHFLRGYQGKCANLHGHRWKIEIFVVGDFVDSLGSGILVDFKILKDFLKSVVNEWDHKCLNDIKPFTKLNPTAENIATIIFHRLKSVLEKNNIRLEKVRIWETPKSYCEFEG